MHIRHTVITNVCGRHLDFTIGFTSETRFYLPLLRSLCFTHSVYRSHASSMYNRSNDRFTRWWATLIGHHHIANIKQVNACDNTLWHVCKMPYQFFFIHLMWSYVCLVDVASKLSTLSECINISSIYVLSLYSMEFVVL